MQLRGDFDFTDHEFILDGKKLETPGHKHLQTNYPMFRLHNKIASRPGNFPATWNDDLFTFSYFNNAIGQDLRKMYQTY